MPIAQSRIMPLARRTPLATTLPLAVTLLLTAACMQPSALPLPMAPVRAIALAKPVSERRLAILDFADQRPPFEQSEQAIDEQPIGGRHFARDRFFSFHSDDATLPADPAAPPDLRARVTGTGAFAWYPFPNHGWGKPVTAPLAKALPDYLALALEQRGLFARVIRAPTIEAATSAGADLVLYGQIARFGAQLAELRDPFVVRSDDWTELRLLAGVDYSITLAPPDGGPPLLVRQCAAREDAGRHLDALERQRGNQQRPLWQLDAAHFPGYAEADLVGRTRRALESASVPLIAAIEAAVTPPQPPAQ